MLDRLPNRPVNNIRNYQGDVPGSPQGIGPTIPPCEYGGNNSADTTMFYDKLFNFNEFMYISVTRAYDILYHLGDVCLSIFPVC